MDKNAPDDAGLDSLLGELDAMAAPSGSLDDLDSLLDGLGSDLPADAPDPATHDAAAAAQPAQARPRRLRRPGVAALLLAAGALASHGALFALGHWLGGKNAPHGEAAGHAEGPAPLEGVLRHVGHPADLRVDGHLIFTTPEVREAVLELNGGQSLADALEKFARRVRSLGPVIRDGDVLEAKACNPDRCGAEAFSLRYNTHTHQVWVCQTVPYAGGNSLSYLYSEEGMEEVARCTDQTPLPVAKGEETAPEQPGATDAEQPEAQVHKPESQH